jgi:16S rRNA U1498 N3-methylase RsmE
LQRFDDVAAGTLFTKGECRPQSGKWNFYFAQETAADLRKRGRTSVEAHWQSQIEELMSIPFPTSFEQRYKEHQEARADRIAENARKAQAEAI